LDTCRRLQKIATVVEVEFPGGVPANLALTHKAVEEIHAGGASAGPAPATDADACEPDVRFDVASGEVCAVAGVVPAEVPLPSPVSRPSA
uniref:hypothetical protein n=1 Tax=Nocardia cyriacigeorgica TaxID=135487 RepID=UPI002453E24F